jgi:hypothetical protein
MSWGGTGGEACGFATGIGWAARSRGGKTSPYAFNTKTEKAKRQVFFCNWAKVTLARVISGLQEFGGERGDFAALT